MSFDSMSSVGTQEFKNTVGDTQMVKNPAGCLENKCRKHPRHFYGPLWHLYSTRFPRFLDRSDLGPEKPGALLSGAEGLHGLCFR